MLVGKQFIYGNIVVAIAEVSSLSRFLSCASRSGDCSYMNLVLYQSCICQRKCRKLDGSREASRVCYIMSLAYVFACALAQTIYEFPSCIISVQPEIVSQVDYPALRLDVVRVHELT